MKKTILTSIILSGSSFLIYESAQFAINQGIPELLAWLVAVTLESFCLVCATYDEIKAKLIVCAFVVLVLFASSYNRVDPVLSADTITQNQNRLLAAYDKDIQSLESKLTFFEKTGQKTNHAVYTKKLIDAQAEQKALLKKIEASPASSVTVFSMGAKIWGIVFLRLFVQLSNIFCAAKLGMHRTEYRAKKYDSGYSKIAGNLKHHEPVQAKVEPVSNNLKEFEFSSNAFKLLEYIDNSGGKIKRGAMLASRKLEGASAYDKAIDELTKAGVLQISTNGKKSNTLYQL